MALLKRSLSVFCAALVFASASPSWSQTETPNPERVQALQKQLDELKAKMEDIQTQILELTKPSQPVAPASAATSSQTVSAPVGAPPAATALQAQESSAMQDLESRVTPKRKSIGEATSSYETDSQDEFAAPRIDNAPLDPRFPGYFRLPGTQTLLRIGGYAKTDFIYDLKPAGDPDRFIPSTFPVPQVSSVNNTTVSVRPTRMNLDFLVPVNSSSIRFFIEFDLFGSNSTTPRLRHAYGQAANFLVGQSFSNFMDPDSGPDTLEFQGPNSQVSIRNPQLRYSIPISEKMSLAFSLEKASSDVSFKTPEFNSLPNSPTPDGAIKLRQEFTMGHIQLSTIMRSPSAYLPNGKTGSVFGWGVDLTGALKIAGKDTFVYQGAYGAGYERYVNDTSGLGIDAQLQNPSNPHLAAVPLTAVYGGYQHYWLPKLRSSAVYGFAQVENTDLEPGSDFHQSNYSAANIIWNPYRSLNVGTEVLYGWIEEKSGSKANDTRFMFSAKYNLIRSAETKKK